jgi:hypothetical protein
MENLSQNEQIRKHLESGKSITPLEALSLFGCLRLGARIHNLKEMGMAICSRIVNENGKHYAEYSLAKLMIVGLILFSSCESQRHMVRMSQLEQQYEHNTSAGDDWLRIYRNQWQCPHKKTRIPFTQIYIY